MRVVILASVFSLGVVAVGAQQRDVTQRNVPAGKAVLTGQTVTTGDPARPLRRVLLTLSGAEIRGDRQVMSELVAAGGRQKAKDNFNDQEN